MSALISIIVPVYNMEPYLGKCIESLISQSYPNIEIILVDDGSKDSSLSICQRYAETDNRIRVVHKENGGSSSARNAGLDVACGELVSFVDADDYIERDAILMMYNTLVEKGADIAHMKSNIVDCDHNILNVEGNNTLTVSTISSHGYVAEMCRKRKSESVCDKIFKSSLFEKNRFEQGRRNEDFFFLSTLLFNDLTIAEVDYVGYNYYQRQGSITHSGFSKTIIDAVRNSYELKELAAKEKPELEADFARITLFQARVALITMPWEYVRTRSTEYTSVMTALCACLPFLRKSDLPKSNKLFLKAVSSMPRLTLRLTSIIWKLKNK